MKKNGMCVYVLLGIFLGLLFCSAAGNELAHHLMQEEGVVSYTGGKASALYAVSSLSWSPDFQKGESLMEENGSVNEETLADMQGLRQILGLFFCLALTFLMLRELKAGFLAFLRFHFILPQFPGHIIEVIHRKDGKKKRLLF